MWQCRWLAKIPFLFSPPQKVDRKRGFQPCYVSALSEWCYRPNTSLTPLLQRTGQKKGQRHRIVFFRYEVPDFLVRGRFNDSANRLFCWCPLPANKQGRKGASSRVKKVRLSFQLQLMHLNGSYYSLVPNTQTEQRNKSLQYKNRWVKFINR